MVKSRISLEAESSRGYSTDFALPPRDLPRDAHPVSDLFACSRLTKFARARTMLSLPPLSCLQLAARPAHHLWWAGQSPGLNVPLTRACVLSELWPFALCHLWVRQNLAAVVPIRPCVPSQRPTMAFYTSW